MMVFRVLGSSEFRTSSCGDSEVVVNLITEFTEVKNGSWKGIIGISGSFVWVGTIINGNGRDIQILANTTNWKWIIESVIDCPIILFSH